MDSYVPVPHYVKYRVLQSYSDFSLFNDLPSLTVRAGDEIILAGILYAEFHGYFYNLSTQAFGFLPLLPQLIVIVHEDLNAINTLFSTGVHPAQQVLVPSPPLALNFTSLTPSTPSLGSTASFGPSEPLLNTHVHLSMHMNPLSSSESSLPVESATLEGETSNPKLSVTFLKGQQRHCKEPALKYPEEVFNLMCPMYNYVMIRNTDSLIFTNTFETLVNERLALYTDIGDWKVWKVWNNKDTNLHKPYFELKKQLPSRFTNPMIFEMFLIFNEWESSGRDLDLLIQDGSVATLNTPLLDAAPNVSISNDTLTNTDEPY